MTKRRRKKRTHVEEKKTNKCLSLVVESGKGTKLADDLRVLLSPHAASLKLRMREALRAASTVSHLLFVSSKRLRLACAPRGPTLEFAVREYSLIEDITRSLQHPQSIHSKSPPLLVLSGFSQQRQDALCAAAFQSLLPPIDPGVISPPSVRRVMLIVRQHSSILLRHYAVSTTPAHVSQRLCSLRSLPNLAHLENIADYLLTPEETKAQDTSSEETVKLVELGPRITLDLVKIEEGICSGKVLYHAYIAKTKDEEAELEKRHQEKLLEKEKRKAQQQENIERKKQKLG